jgi:hypothetical protein
MSRNKKDRKKKKQNQDAAAADGGLLSVRRNMQHATGARDNSMRKIWMIGIVLVALAFLLLVFTP